MSSTILSIIVSVSSAVGKTFMIGAVGYLSVTRPKDKPLLPAGSIDMLSRLSFNMLMLPMIFTGLAASVTWQSLSSLWLIIIASFGVILTSFIVSTILAYMPFFRIDKEKNFGALRIAICFPNIVAIPILLFPELCEYEVFHEFGKIGNDDDQISFDQKMKICEAETNAIVFTYFFGFSLLFWSFGYRALKKTQESIMRYDDGLEEADSLNQNERSGKSPSPILKIKNTCFLMTQVIKDIFLSPGFIILILAFVTACIQPLQKALFQPGGHLRVIGSTLEAFSDAGATFATIVVAAALAENNGEKKEEIITNHQMVGDTGNDDSDGSCDKKQKYYGLLHTATKITNGLSRPICNILHHPTFKVQVWHLLSRLILTPTLVFTILLALDCKVNLSATAKLVLLVNSSLPGALIVVVILKANGFTNAASIVAQTYLPSYTVSVVTTAVWSSIGMAAFSGSEVCS